MSVSNIDCSGYKLTLKSCYRLMNSLRSRPEYVVENNLCDAPFIHYIDCLKKAMEGKDIDIEELRSYHSEKIGSKDEPLTK